MSPYAPVVVGRLRNLFDVDANTLVIDAHLEVDPLLRQRVRAHPGLRVPGCWDAFELGLRAILGQQVSVAGATTLSGRLAEQFGDRIDTPWIGIEYLSPTAPALARTDAGAIAEIGIPKARATTIRGLAAFAAGGGFQFSGTPSLGDAIARLKQVRGIGDWTAQYIAMRALRLPDAFPAGDLGLRKAADGDSPVSAAEMMRRADDSGDGARGLRDMDAAGSQLPRRIKRYGFVTMSDKPARDNNSKRIFRGLEPSLICPWIWGARSFNVAYGPR